MKAVLACEPGGPDVLSLGEAPDPSPAAGEVLLDVAATAVNRADLLQRAGKYPPPAGASPILGLECSGRIAALGEGVTGWQVGDEVCALLSGGGYAERVCVAAVQLMRVPAGLDLISAAALPEVACTVWSMVLDSAPAAALVPGESFLVHGGSSGIGTMAIQLAAAQGCRVFTTAGSAEKLAACRELGAELAINYRDSDFVEVIRAHTEGAGVDVVLDTIGAKYLPGNLDVLATGGRIAVIGLLGGSSGTLSLAALMAKRATVHAAALRSRPLEQKAAIVAGTEAHVWPLVEAGTVRPVVHQVLALAQAADAHRIVESSAHIGKLVLATG
ncbi:MAG TPA: NAD(P)H-quinone oxidoreductase [Jatrophihabitans sp.]|jgi:putative PIG3 family NAD(P)H quinone oxidoreductase|uniref:NAD(P)H-quinone oxidoreductase n=1 Tax=Jatrophihabitans sp. TaxID=1932789 RepID=UPI002EDD20E2